MAMKSTRRAYVTLLGSDDFVKGVVMLDWSLRKVKSSFPLMVMCSKNVSKSAVSELEKRHIPFQILPGSIDLDKSSINLDEGYAHWNNTFDKLFAWTLTQFEKVVFLDSDMQVRADVFNEPGLDKLNSGLMVIEPSMEEFEGLCSVIDTERRRLKNMGDQDVIRAYYKEWGSRPQLTLAAGLNVFYSEVSRGIIRKSDVDPVSVIHYIGPNKPWMVSARAIWRRSRNNFLGRELLRYAVAMYFRFPLLLLKWK